MLLCLRWLAYKLSKSLKWYPSDYIKTINLDSLSPNDVSAINMKEASAIYTFVIIALKMATNSSNFGMKKWHPLFHSPKYFTFRATQEKSFSSAQLLVILPVCY